MTRRVQVLCTLAVVATVIALIHLFSVYGNNNTLGRRWLDNNNTDTATEAVPDVSAEHKDLFPLDDSDYWGIVLVSLGLVIAASGGIGGGGILVPLFILVFGFSPKHAIPLSNFTIVGSSITNMVLNIPKRHPHADRPLVDWDLIMVMEPVTMIGAVSKLDKKIKDEIVSVRCIIMISNTNTIYLFLDCRCFHE